MIEKDKEIQLVSSPENSLYIEKLIKDELQEDLTPASLEVLAIIAYKSPVTRAEIEEIRGVNSSFTLRNLLIRGLIERKERLEDSRAYLYEISLNFLRKLGLKSINELPEYNNLHQK
jgi:segregation and condensation protein B